ncbi:MAG: hypothetical protein R3D25_14790 [Geminicoccaceae bacterium]
MWRWSSIFLGLAVLLLPCTGVRAQGPSADCGSPIGKWDWPTGGVVTIVPGGQLSWAPVVDGAAVFTATWVCDTNDGQIVIAWPQGITDRLRLSSDGERLDGANDRGVTLAARRWREVEAAAPAGPVPPALVGTWLLEVQLPTAQGPVAVVWTIAADGSYVIDAGPFSHAGNMTAQGGNWEQAATTSGFTDGGTYALPNWARLQTRARSGMGGWNRIQPDLALAVIAVSDQALPSGLPDLAARARLVAQGWRPDAELVGIEFEQRDSHQWNAKDEVELRYVSPASGAGLVMTVATDGTRFFAHDVVNWGSGTIPDGFLDLPAVWAIARQHGLVPPLARANLQVWQPGDAPILAWQLSSSRGENRGVSLDGVGGTLLEGDLTGYIAAYNAQWQAAAEGLRRLFAPARRSSGPSTGTTSWDSSSSSSSSSYDTDDGGSSSSAYDTASQNSWSAGDMRAYDRIQSGTPTGDDCYRYGC